MPIRRVLLQVAVFAASVLAPAAKATERGRAFHETRLVGRTAPAGAQLRTTVYLRHPLQTAPTGTTRNHHPWIGAGPTIALGPAAVRGGLAARVDPLSFVSVSTRWEAVGYFGTFDQLLSWPGTYTTNETSLYQGTLPQPCTPNAPGCRPLDYSDQARDRLASAGAAYPTRGGTGQVQARIGGSWGSFQAHTTIAAHYARLTLRPADSVFYDATLDLVRPGTGWAVQTDADLRFVGIDPWGWGARLTSVHAVHPTETTAADWTHRVGPLLAYSGLRADWMHHPTVFLLPQWWLRHPYRTGAETPRALPQVWLAVEWTASVERGR